MPYSAGDLSVELFGIDTNAVASIDNTAKSLKRLSSALRSIEKLQSIFIGNKIENIFDSIARATNSINATNIERLASATKSLTSLSKIGKLQDIDYGKIGQGFASLTTAITPFIDKIKTAETSLVALYGTLSKANGKKIQNLLGENTTPTRPKGSGLFSAIGLTAVLHVARRLGRVVAKIAQSGADYTETLNLWETAMTRNLDQATAFVKKMNEAYGISEKTLMNAQATFKNMLGSLGQISESTAYALSEGITQMAIDYASLYNVTFDKAFEKFQSVLAGQVRPIRSVSGYDITENTIYELYKQLGGEKSVRNLSRTEKQLLAILAVFNQMQASGAIGDLNKTMESYANQSRVMAEAWSEMVSYAGILLTYLLQESGIITFISAVLMYITDHLKEIANQWGAIKSFGGDIFGATEQSAENASNAIDELNGKLADFDKFRALNESEDNAVGLDNKVLEAFERYETILANVSNTAREWANSDWLPKVLRNLRDIVDLVLVIIGANIISALKTLGTTLHLTGLQSTVLIMGLSILVMGISRFIDAWGDMGWGQRIITMFTAMTAAVIGFIIAFKWLKLGASAAIAAAATLAGLVFATSSHIVQKGVPKFAEGGLPDKGTMFVAGEAGAEMVYNMPSGQSGVANIQQIAQANYNGTIKALNDWWGGMSAKQDIPKLQSANATGLYQAVTGVAKAQGERWSKY